MTYAYECLVCGNRFDVDHGMSEQPLIECPKCRVAGCKRLVTGGKGFVLRGDGWARDGYASKAKGA